MRVVSATWLCTADGVREEEAEPPARLNASAGSNTTADSTSRAKSRRSRVSEPMACLDGLYREIAGSHRTEARAKDGESGENRRAKCQWPSSRPMPSYHKSGMRKPMKAWAQRSQLGGEEPCRSALEEQRVWPCGDSGVECCKGCLRHLNATR